MVSWWQGSRAMSTWVCAAARMLLPTLPVLLGPACSSLTAPEGPDPANLPAASSSVASDAQAISVSHILVAYKGAPQAAPDTTRTKDEAQAKARLLADQAKAPDADFAALAQQFSDDTKSKANGGAIPRFVRGRWPKPLTDAAYQLQVGQVSDVVETDYGFHIVKRTR